MSWHHNTHNKIAFNTQNKVKKVSKNKQTNLSFWIVRWSALIIASLRPLRRDMAAPKWLDNEHARPRVRILKWKIWINPLPRWTIHNVAVDTSSDVWRTNRNSRCTPYECQNLLFQLKSKGDHIQFGIPLSHPCGSKFEFQSQPTTTTISAQKW